MPTPEEFLKLVIPHPTMPRTACTALKATLAHDPAFPDGIAAVFALFDPATGRPSGQSLFVALDQFQAMSLAKLIQGLAKEQGWPDLPDEPLSRIHVPDPSKLS